jgi:hypothetical protein
MLLLMVSADPAQSHDPSAWGGLFRSRDAGATWVSANRGHYLSGAIALAVSPTDPNHLLLGAESGIFRSRSGGRDWKIEAPSVVIGSVFAAAFVADGRQALISTGSGIFRGERETIGGRSRRHKPLRRCEPLFLSATPACFIWPAGPAYIAAATGVLPGRVSPTPSVRRQ